VILASTLTLRSIVLLSPAGDLISDFSAHLGGELVRSALSSDPNQIIEIDFDWRERFFLRAEFFQQLPSYKLKELIKTYENAFYVVAGMDDFCCRHAEEYYQLSPSSDKKLWLILEADHVFNFAGAEWPLGGEVAKGVIERFTQTLAYQSQSQKIPRAEIQ